MMNYYIDPQTGSDDNPAANPTRPWRSFAPLCAIELGPDDRIDIVAPGAFAESLVLHGCGTPEHPIRVRFAPGRYDLFPDDARRKRYHISNTNDAPDDPKAIGILIENASHVRIEGAGAKLVCRGKMIELCIDHSEDVEVSGLGFDYHRPTVSEFVVVDSTPDCADLRMHPDSTYRIDENRLTWVGEGWECPPGGRKLLAQRLDLETGYLARCRDPLPGLLVEQREPLLLRCRGTHALRTGDVYQVRDTFRDCVGVFVNRSRDVRFRHLNFYFLHGMGLLCQFTRNLQLNHVSIAPDPASARTTSAWADCFHASGCAGRVVVEDCVFDGAHDDAINIHGTYLRVVDCPAENQVRVRFMHRQTYGFAAFVAGDEIEFVRGDSLETYAANRVTDAVMLDPHEMLLTLEHPAPGDLREHDAIENVTWTPQVEIRRCVVRRIPTRGFLLSSRGRTVVEDNHFIKTQMEGIHIGGDATNWYESGPVHDMTIQRNVFDHCRTAAIVIKPNVSVPEAVVHRNIRIRDNRILPQDATDVVAHNVSDLIIQP